MSVVFSGLNSGSFISTGVAKVLQLPAGVDELWIVNYTQWLAAGGGQGVRFYWQRGMANGGGLQETKTAVTGALAATALAANAGFFLVDSSLQTPGAQIAVTSITNATPPVVATGNTGSLAVGGIVRLISITGGTQLNGIDYTVGTVVANTSFTLAYQPPIVAATTGFYRQIFFDPIYYPRRRYITAVRSDTVNSALAVITLSVTHGYTVGQKVRFIIPKVGNSATYFGMTQLNGLEGTIVAVGTADVSGYTNTVTVDIDVSTFTAFTFPVTGVPVFTPAQMIPVGENTAQALTSNTNILADATENQAYFGMILAAGANSPAGVNNDVICWVAGKSFNQ